MKDFIYVETDTIEETYEFLEQHGDECKILGGGCSLVILLKQGLIVPEYLVSIGRIAGLDSIDHQNGELRIGAMVTHRVLELSTEIKRIQPMLSEMASCIGQVQVRNLGTIGGNLCHAEYRADPPAALAALNAKVVLTSSVGTRTLAVEDFIKDYYLTDIRSNEILTEISIPDLPSESLCKYVRFSPRSVMEEPVVTVAAVSVPDHDGRLRELRLALGAVAPKPTRVREVEELLTNEALNEVTMKEAASLAANASDPLDDVYGPADWKREMVRVHVFRTLETIQRHLLNSRGGKQ